MISLSDTQSAAWARLPFVSVEDRGDDTAAVSFWSVVSDGDHNDNCAAGRDYATALINYFVDFDDASLLPRVIADMPRDLRGVEIGFLTALAQRCS